MTRVRSTLEAQILEWLLDRDVSFIYEGAGLSYTTKHIYTPDFVLKTKTGKNIYIEAKGWFQPKDRTKMIHIKKQHPKADIRFVFQNPQARLYKGSKTTYAQWATKWKFPWSDNRIPTEWIKE
jgi:predicted nuclease of restriction endonuclease-like RecB superfamily